MIDVTIELFLLHSSPLLLQVKSLKEDLQKGRSLLLDFKTTYGSVAGMVRLTAVINVIHFSL